MEMMAARPDGNTMVWIYRVAALCHYLVVVSKPDNQLFGM